MPRKALRSDWGCVQEVERGKRYRIRYWAETADGYKRCSETVRGTKRDAYDRLAALRLDHSKDAPCPTVGECWEKWYLPDLKRRVEAGEAAKSTLSQYTSLWNKNVGGQWGKCPISEVKPLRVQQWISGLTYSQAASCVPLFRSVLAYGVRYEIIDANPLDADYIMPARSTSAKRDDGIWTLAQLGELWGLVSGQWLEGAFLLMAFGGCRVGEALAPLCDDVSLTSYDGVSVATVNIRAQVRNSGEPSTRLKNKWSRRTIAIPGRAAERLGELAATREHGWLTDNGVGEHATQRQYAVAWQEIVPAHLYHVPKQLRPSWQTYMRWELKVPPYLIEPMMGHVGEGVTGVHYDKPLAEQFVETVASAYKAHPFDVGWDI